jgi:hypothetical protein
MKQLMQLDAIGHLEQGTYRYYTDKTSSRSDDFEGVTAPLLYPH